ncbi:MAG: hypothetical protein PHU25_04070 [Deltaproteobacteria bacterium]|nr:hypothetical protein [Deltaproteobacteria bacterium]
MVAVFLLASLALAGCPRLRVAEVRLAAPSKGGKLTLVANVETQYQPESVKEPKSYAGRGVIAVWLPPGWKATGARIRPPGQEQAESMPLVPEVAPEFPVTFPYQPGAWWPFVASDREIPVGTTVFPVEIDAEGPAGMKALTLGIALGAVSDCAVGRKVGVADIEDPPTEVAIDLRSGKITVRDRVMPSEVQVPGCEKTKPEPAQDAAPEQKHEPAQGAEPAQDTGPLVCDCNCPKVAPADRGPRGCSCSAAGSAMPATSLLPLLVDLLIL